MVLGLFVLVGTFTNDPGLASATLLLTDTSRDLGLNHEFLPALTSGPFTIGALIRHDHPHLIGEFGGIQKWLPECCKKTNCMPGQDKVSHIAPHVEPLFLVHSNQTLIALTKTPLTLIRPDASKTYLCIQVFHQNKLDMLRLTNRVCIQRGALAVIITTSKKPSQNTPPTTPPPPPVNGEGRESEGKSVRPKLTETPPCEQRAH